MRHLGTRRYTYQSLTGGTSSRPSACIGQLCAERQAFSGKMSVLGIALAGTHNPAYGRPAWVAEVLTWCLAGESNNMPHLVCCSVISFTIPRWHEVTPVIGNKPRYSVSATGCQPQLQYLAHHSKLPPWQQRLPSNPDSHLEHAHCALVLARQTPFDMQVRLLSITTTWLTLHAGYCRCCCAADLWLVPGAWQAV